jgi:hypothetical protein
MLSEEDKALTCLNGFGESGQQPSSRGAETMSSVIRTTTDHHHTPTAPSQEEENPSTTEVSRVEELATTTTTAAANDDPNTSSTTTDEAGGIDPGVGLVVDDTEIMVKWSNILQSPTSDPSFSPSLPIGKSLHGLALTVTVERTKSLAKCGKRCSNLLQGGKKKRKLKKI